MAFMVEYFQTPGGTTKKKSKGTAKRIGQTGPYLTRRSAAADAKTMVRNMIGAKVTKKVPGKGTKQVTVSVYPITETYTMTANDLPKMVPPKVMKKEKFAEWSLFRETGRKKYDRRRPDKVPEVSGYIAEGVKGVISARIVKANDKLTSRLTTLAEKYNPRTKTRSIVMRVNGKVYGYFGPFASESIAKSEAAKLRTLVPAGVTVEVGNYAIPRNTASKRRTSSKRNSARRTAARGSQRRR